MNKTTRGVGSDYHKATDVGFLPHIFRVARSERPEKIYPAALT